MERLSRMPGRYSIPALLILLLLVAARPVMAEKKDEGVTMPPVATASAIISALARQIAFVKTFSVEYPYQYEQQTANEKAGNGKER